MTAESLATYALSERYLIDAPMMQVLFLSKIYACAPILSTRTHETHLKSVLLISDRSIKTSQSVQENIIPPQEASFQEEDNVSQTTSIAEQIGYSFLKGSNVYIDLQHQVEAPFLLSSFTKFLSFSKTKQAATSILLTWAEEQVSQKDGNAIFGASSLNFRRTRS